VSARRLTREELFAQIQVWNQRYPVGTEVTSDVYPGTVYKTRTAAVPLFEQKPVIYLDGFNGYFDLHEIHPVGKDAGIDNAANDSGVGKGEPVQQPEAAKSERVVVVFPGQGSQFKGMGKELFATYRQLTDAADAILGYSIEELCLKDPQDHLKQTQYTQPAIYVVNALGHRLMQESGAIPAEIDALAGHSVGEYNALLVAGVFDFETGLRLVVERGRLMSQANGGGMAAVIGMKADDLRGALDAAGLLSIDLANFNSPLQTVISGTSADVQTAIQTLSTPQVKVIRLPVSAAFHSRFMQAAQQDFARFLAAFRFTAPSVPVIANATALPYQPDAIVETLSRQISSPVRWTDSINGLLRQGETRFIEVGGTILTRMIAEIRAHPAP
jgi:malonyl CoA-acyl carrier protein transacylase